MKATITELWRYPVKSMQGEQVETASLSPSGFAGDRGYALFDPEARKVGSAKHPRLWGDLLQARARYASEPQPGGPLPPVVITLPDGDELRSDDAGVDAHLSSFVGRPVQLVTRPPSGDNSYLGVWPTFDGVMPDDVRQASTVEGATEPDGTLAAHRLSMAAPPGTMFDVAALHVVALATLGHLQDVAPDSRFTVQRYRPNVVVDGPLDPFAENGWMGGTMQLGADARASVLMPTMRCIMTTLAQGELPRDVEVLRTLTKHNRIDIPGIGTWSCVGAYASVEAGGGITTGDDVGLP